MNWLALRSDPHWRQFWASDEIKDKRANLIAMMIAGRWEQGSIDFLRGQLKMLDDLEKMASVLADRQLKDEPGADAEEPTRSRVARMFDRMRPPRVS